MNVSVASAVKMMSSCSLWFCRQTPLRLFVPLTALSCQGFGCIDSINMFVIFLCIDNVKDVCVSLAVWVSVA